jgi:hypothetical protein
MWIRYFLQDAADDKTGGAGGGTGATGADTGGAGDGADTGAAGDDKGSGAGDAGKGAAAGDAGAGAFKFPENWREGLATGDVKKIERLSRYATPQAVADALLSVQARISAGELRSNVPFPEKGTDAEKAEWRKEQGLPETHDKYELKLRDGLTIPAEDKDRIGSFTQALHAKNAPPAVVSQAVEWYYDEVAKATEERATKDKAAVESTRDSLVAEMGVAEFKTNLNLVNGMIETMPASVKELFKGGRLADGTPLFGGNADAFKGLADWARKINPVTALVPGAGANTASAINDEIKKYETMMREDRPGWNKDTAGQKRYQELIAAREASGTHK